MTLSLMALPDMIPGSMAAIIAVMIATDAILQVAEYLERRLREEKQRGNHHATDD